MYCYEKMYTLVELLTMTVDLSKSNTTCSYDSTLEDSMWHIPPFKISQRTKGLFFVWPLGGLFLDIPLVLLEFGFYLMIIHFLIEKSVVDTLSHLGWTFIIMERLCKSIPPNIRMIDNSKKRRVKSPSGGFFALCKINVYGLECFRYVCHEILIRIDLTFLP